MPIPDVRHGDSNIMHGLTAALEALTECSDAQLEKLKSPENKSKVSFYLFKIILCVTIECLSGSQQGTSNLHKLFQRRWIHQKFRVFFSRNSYPDQSTELCPNTHAHSSL